MYPKVLIIGQSFNSYTGGGITLTNLFKGWDIDNIAVAAERISDIDFIVCKNYFQLGSNESRRRFPFNLIEKKYKSGKVIPGLVTKELNNHNEIPYNKKYPFLTGAYNQVLHSLGIYHYSRMLTVTNGFLAWFNEFKPDIIYSQLASLELIQFVIELNIKTKVPVAIHIMDDWPKTISSKGLLSTYWRTKIDREFRILLNRATVLLSISEAMSLEYKQRYSKDFQVFHNPVDFNKWQEIGKNDYIIKGSFDILYTGRVGLGVDTSLKKIAQAIQILNEKYSLNISLIIQTKQDLDWINKYDFIFQRFITDYSLYPKSLLDADLLLLPYDFDEKSIRFIKYSMPTKASEYMISGMPILVFAPKETALCQHAMDYGWGYVVSEEKPDVLINAIKELMTNDKLRRELGKKAREFAVLNFDADLVRENFRRVLSNVKEINLI